MAQNLVSKFSYAIRQNQAAIDALRNQPVTAAFDAFLGDNTGVITAYEGVQLPAGYVVVRDTSGNLSVAYNQEVPLTPGLAIKVGYDPIQPVLFQVLSIRDYLTENPALHVPNHHETHEFPGNDTIFITSWQFLPGLLFANNGFIVEIYPMFFRKSDGSRGYLPNTTLDLSSYVPVTGAQAFTLVVDDDGVVTVEAGTTAGSIGLLSLVNFPTLNDPTLHELWGVRLYNSQSEISYLDTYDFRFGGVSGGGSGSGPIILSETGAVMPTEPQLQFTGPNVQVTDSSGGSRTIVNIAESDIPVTLLGIARWAALPGDDTFDFPDLVSAIQGVQVNGLNQDPLTYNLSALASQLVLDTALPADAIVTANYTLEVL